MGSFFTDIAKAVKMEDPVVPDHVGKKKPVPKPELEPKPQAVMDEDEKALHEMEAKLAKLQTGLSAAKSAAASAKESEVKAILDARVMETEKEINQLKADIATAKAAIPSREARKEAERLLAEAAKKEQEKKAAKQKIMSQVIPFFESLNPTEIDAMAEVFLSLEKKSYPKTTQFVAKIK